MAASQQQKILKEVHTCHGS